jgi:hypothetical protein
MIVFDLACECGLIFEGWFSDRADFACQDNLGLLVCPRDQAAQDPAALQAGRG